MDKKVFEALNNFAFAIEEMVNVMQNQIDSNDKTSKAKNAFNEQKNLANHLIAIEEGVKMLNDKSEKMIAKQDEILSIAKSIKDSKEKANTFSAVTDEKKKKNIKDGVQTVFMIAASVLAIGLAFKVIGGVDFASVIALSIAMPLLAIAFEKVATTLSNVKEASAIQVGLVLVGMSIATVLASYALQYVRPVSPIQLITSIGIAATFAIASSSIGKLVNGIKNVTTKTLIILPLVLVSMATAIMGASYMLQYVKPITLPQLFTAIGIAATFAVAAYSINTLSKNIQNIKIKDLVILPLVLVAMATAIAASSLILQYVQPMSFNTMLSAIMVSATLAVASLTIGLSIWALNKLGIDLKKAITGGLTIVAIAGVIVASSLVLGMYQPIPIDKIINIAAFSIGLAVSVLVVGITAIILNKIGSIKDALIGGLTIILLSGVIMATSLILNYGNYKKYPSLDWALGVGASIFGFGLAAVALGFVMLTGIGAVAILAGAATMIGLAASLVEIDAILQKGQFKKFPSLQWAEGVGKALSSIGGVLANMGISGVLSNALGSLFGSSPVDIAESMVEIDAVLQKGQFKKFPSLQWADGVSTAIQKFSMMKEILSDMDSSDIEITIQNIRLVLARLASVSIEAAKMSNIPALKMNGLDTILNMASAYDKLASSLNNLSSSLNNLQQNQLDGLKMLTGNIISLSVIDPDNFDKIMEIVKSRSQDLSELFNNVTNQIQSTQVQAGGNTNTQSNAVKTVNNVNKSEGKTLDDVYDEIVKSNKYLSSISSNMNSVSNFLNDLRVSDINIKHGTI